MGSGRRQHHAQEQAKRDAARAAEQQKAMMDQQQKAFEEQLKVQREAMMAQTQAMREALAPNVTKSTMGAQNIGVRTSRSTKQTTSNIGRGISALRIPLNLGGGGDSGLNIG